MLFRNIFSSVYRFRYTSFLSTLLFRYNLLSSSLCLVLYGQYSLTSEYLDFIRFFLWHFIPLYCIKAFYSYKLIVTNFSLPLRSAVFSVCLNSVREFFSMHFGYSPYWTSLAWTLPDSFLPLNTISDTFKPGFSNSFRKVLLLYLPEEFYSLQDFSAHRLRTLK
jgi:hypothetical protein